MTDGEQLALGLTAAHLHPLGLEELGLEAGDRVRFRRREGGRWHEGVAADRRRDGSVGLFETDGRARAIRPEQLEVLRAGPRGGKRWVPVATG